ncbi:MAG: flagellar type III secretion system pore protein FliP [Pseudomonadota bacterium]
MKNNRFYKFALFGKSGITLLIILATQNALAANTGIPVIDDLIGQGSNSAKVMQLFLLITVLGIAPSILIMTTSFVRIAIVLGMVRTALGLQQSPPNQVVMSLALFLTFFIMSPALEESYENGIRPMIEEKISEEEAIPHIVQPFKKFMLANTRSKDLDLFISIAKEDPKQEVLNLPLKIVIPSFMISELRRAFEIGFLIFLPFLIIDIVVSSILMAMGMMMMPPVMVALPFKIIFFVVIDGWYLLAGSLVRSFAV